jgi:folate-dependent phosphoribosylglycinamide formyltransferase PurN
LHERIKVVERNLIVETVAEIARDQIDLEEIARR